MIALAGVDGIGRRAWDRVDRLVCLVFHCRQTDTPSHPPQQIDSRHRGATAIDYRAAAPTHSRCRHRHSDSFTDCIDAEEREAEKQKERQTKKETKSQTYTIISSICHAQTDNNYFTHVLVHVCGVLDGWMGSI